MLGMTDIDLKQTRFYQNVLAEGRQEGRKEGKRADRKARPRVAKPKPHACCVACSPAALAHSPTGPANTSARATTEQLEAWALRVLDDKSLEAILRGSPSA